jgi:hypothetical protein
MQFVGPSTIDDLSDWGGQQSAHPLLTPPEGATVLQLAWLLIEIEV